MNLNKKITIRDVAKLLANDSSVNDITERFQVSRRTVYNRIKQLKDKHRCRHTLPAVIAEVREMENEDEQLRQWRANIVDFF